MNENDIKKVIEGYSKLSNEQLMAEFAKHFARQKSKDGGVGMRQTIERIMPLLNEQQRARIKEILANVDTGDN